MKVRSGLDILRAGGFGELRGRRVGVLCHHASVAADFRHITSLLNEHKVSVSSVFTPEHGLWGSKDTRIPNLGAVEPRSGYRVHSLYGDSYRPSPEMLAEIDLLLIDLQDVGARFYTYTWSMAHCLAACAEAGKEVWVLDRPNPIAGKMVEGPVLEPAWSSFVGLHPVAQRHGMTFGEMATWIRQGRHPNLALRVIKMENWRRDMEHRETGLPWIPPSPNMPRVSTARVYPGIGLLEGTDLSEGRGTTRPFEVFGHPVIDGWRLAAELNAKGRPGAYFRPIYFQPTWSKHAGKGCGGAFLHVTHPTEFEAVASAIEVLSTIQRLWPEAVGWQEKSRRDRFDRLAGCSWLRESLAKGESTSSIRERIEATSKGFLESRQAALCYFD